MKYYMQWNITQLWKEWYNVNCSNMDRLRDYHTDWNKSDKDKYHMISPIGGILKKIVWMYLFTKQKETHRQT